MEVQILLPTSSVMASTLWSSGTAAAIADTTLVTAQMVHTSTAI